jgi:cell division septation protein DedD
MMKNKDYRELQLSSSQLFFIFLAILILGVVIFLLGVSVGKKQAQIMKGAQIAAKEKAEPAEDQTSPPAEESKESISKELASLQKATEETKEQPAVSDDRTLFYIQVGAFNRREMAVSFAEIFNQRGYPAFVLDPFPSDRREIFRVRIGGYATREEAEEVRTKLKSEASRETDYFIIRS